MAIAFVQSNYAVPSTSASVAVAFSSAQTVGNLNVVVVGWNDVTHTVSSVTDTKGNSYSLAVGPTKNGATNTLTQSIYYAPSIAAAAAGANTVTVAFSGTATAPDIRILEYSGLATSSPVDVTAAAGGSGAVSSGSATTTSANDLIFGACTVTNVVSAVGSGFTQRILTTPNGDLAEDQIVSATGSYAATATVSGGSWAMQMVAFKMATGGASVASSTGTSTASGVAVAPNVFAIDNSGNITVTATGASTLSARTYTLTVQATNSYGSGTGTDTIVAASAPTGTFPTAATTGVPSGTTLTPSGGFTVSTNNQTYTALDVSGTININSGVSGTTIQNCRITISGSTTSAIQANGATNTTIKHCTLIGPGVNDTLTGSPVTNYLIWNVTNGLIDSCDLSQAGQPINMGTAQGVTIQNCYIHDVNTKGADNTHFECVYCGGTNSVANALVIQNNTMQQHNGVTTVIICQDDFNPLNNITISGNYLDDLNNGVNGWTLYVNNKAGKGISNVQVTNNAFGKGYYGYLYPGGPSGANPTSGGFTVSWPSGVTASGNYDYYNKAPI
jgi:hypothetical protein